MGERILTVSFAQLFFVVGGFALGLSRDVGAVTLQVSASLTLAAQALRLSWDQHRFKIHYCQQPTVIR